MEEGESMQEQIKKMIDGLLEGYTINHNDEDLITLGLDSLKFVELILQIEEKYSIIIPDDKLNILEMNTLMKITNMAVELISEQQGTGTVN